MIGQLTSLLSDLSRLSTRIEDLEIEASRSSSITPDNVSQIARLPCLRHFVGRFPGIELLHSLTVPLTSLSINVLLGASRGYLCSPTLCDPISSIGHLSGSLEEFHFDMHITGVCLPFPVANQYRRACASPAFPGPKPNWHRRQLRVQRRSWRATAGRECREDLAPLLALWRPGVDSRNPRLVLPACHKNQGDTCPTIISTTNYGYYRAFIELEPTNMIGYTFRESFEQESDKFPQDILTTYLRP